jgi:tetratricopeptide (TPR) repeat protein
MTSIFISYARKDQPVARWLAESLGRDGWNVWWDPEIVPGEQFDEKIREKLVAAGCVIVIWSKASVESIWVRAEANEGLERDCLIPISIGDVKPPLPFNQLQAVDFTGWRGDPAHPAYQELVHAVKLRVGYQRGLEEPPVSVPPDVDTRRFSVVVARVQNDIGQQLQEVIATDLAEFEGVHVVTLDKTISSEGPNPEENSKAAAEKARDYLDEMGATIMIWGKILRFAGKEVSQLHLTVSRSKDQRRGRYVPNDELRLPQVFWSDLADILRLVILTYDADFREQEGFYLGNQLQPFIPRVRRLLQRADRTRGWSGDARGLTRVNLGDALMLLGSQSGENEPLEEAIEIYREALTELPRERSPRDWARAQNGLGISLWLLGSRQGDTEMLEEAIAAYHMALTERAQVHEPLEWAQTYNDLGNTLATLGQLKSGTKRLEEAVQAYETALLERTIEAKPLDWAQTKNNLGVALWYLGQREGSTKRLEEAVATLKASFKIYNRQKTPLDWSQTQNNLGLVLWTLGNWENSTERFKEAVKAFQEALRERERGRVPLLWAQTQNNLGLAFLSLGQRAKEVRKLEQGVRAFRLALCERTPERAKMDWAQTQNNLGAVLWSLGILKDGTKELEEAVHAYRNALSVYTREEAALEWAQTQHNLGNALAVLGDRDNDTTRIEEALSVLLAALCEYDPKQEPMPWAQTKGDIGHTGLMLGKRQRDQRCLEEAAKAFAAAQRAYKKNDMEEYANAFALKVEEVKSLIEQLGAETNT